MMWQVQPICDAACAFRPVAIALTNGSHAGPPSPGALARGCFRSGFFSRREHLMRAVSQWSSFAACHTSIAAREALLNAAYDVVMLTRPDTVWYAPVKPHCLHEVAERQVTLVHRGPLRWNSTLEWLLIMPRGHARTLLTTAAVFDGCARRRRHRHHVHACHASRARGHVRQSSDRAGVVL